MTLRDVYHCAIDKELFAQKIQQAQTYAADTVAILKTQPSTVLDDYHELLNLGGYQQVVDKTVDTALKVNISWHFFFPGSSTTPWQLDGVIRAMKVDRGIGLQCSGITVVATALLRSRCARRSPSTSPIPTCASPTTTDGIVCA